MKNIFKQSGESVTNLKQDNFRIAVLRLTAYYTIGVFLIILVFSFLVYSLFSIDLNRQTIGEDEHSSLYESEHEDSIAEELQENLLDVLVFSDLVLLILTLFVSYFLSKKTLAPLQVSYEKQKRFVENVAHELRTPLAVMKAGGEVVLQKERNLDDYKRFISEYLEEVDRLIKLSNDLLFLAQNKKLDNLKEVSLSNICKRQFEQMSLYAQTKGVSLSLNFDKEVTFLGREEDLSRLVLNLLKNAIDYNKPNGEVFLTLEEDRGRIVLSVRDTGLGISEKDLPYIFERFYKADSSRAKDGFSGTGLGLAIVKDITEEYRGKISIKSQIGLGTDIQVTFPLA